MIRIASAVSALSLAFAPCALAQDAAPAEAAPAQATAPEASTPVAAPTEAAAPSQAEAEAAAMAEAQAFYDSLDRRTGAISLVGGKVQLNVPETHYYLGPEDSRRVIVDNWGNPPQTAENIEGMIFLANANPAAGAWGAVLEYLADGHVDDSDAATINYDELLTQLQADTQSTNAQRREMGYPEMTLDGWAEAPHYVQSSHTLYWAKLLSTSDGFSSLNYDIRVLGREGVFVVSFVAAPEEIALIRTEAPAVMAMPQFTEGNRYADFQEGDQVAAYGLGGLIAGGAAMAVAQKTGILALILAFGKKFAVLIIAGLVGAGGAIARMFKKKDNTDGGGDPAP